MGKFIHKFPDVNSYNQARNGNYIEPWVSLTVNQGLNYNKSQYEKLFDIPLTLDILSDGNIVWSCSSHGGDNGYYTYIGDSYGKTIEYKKNDGEWTSITAANGNSAPSISVVTGDVLQFRGNNQYYYKTDNPNSKEGAHGFYGSTANFNVKGNIMSLINSTNFSSLTTLNHTTVTNGYEDSISHFFTNCTTLIDASELILPGVPVMNCYDCMFKGCTNLVSAPKLPATTVSYYSYRKMFKECTSLINAPELPATTLNQECYYQMFYGCTNLTTAPSILPSTTAPGNCYTQMFYNCSNLRNAPELPATTLNYDCYYWMFSGCSSLTQAPELPATTLASWCYYGMFSGCSGLTQAPELPATTLADYCYSSMFSGCSGLTQAPELPVETLANNCYSSMFSGCSGLTQAPELPATTLSSNCYQSMFSSCTSLTTAPELPASTLVSNCYKNMFWGCTNLNYIKALFTTTPSSSYTESWVKNVSGSGTFVKNSSAQWNVTGNNSVPSGWTVQTASE